MRADSVAHLIKCASQVCATLSALMGADIFQNIFGKALHILKILKHIENIIKQF